MPPSFETHRPLLDQALQALRQGGLADVFAAWPRSADYGETAAEAGRAAFEARLGRPFALTGSRAPGRLGTEASPYGFPLAITYPATTPAAWLDAAERSAAALARADIETRVGAALEALVALNAQSFEMAHAVMHTTGQP